MLLIWPENDNLQSTCKLHKFSAACFLSPPLCHVTMDFLNSLPPSSLCYLPLRSIAVCTKAIIICRCSTGLVMSSIVRATVQQRVKTDFCDVTSFHVDCRRHGLSRGRLLDVTWLKTTHDYTALCRALFVSGTDLTKSTWLPFILSSTSEAIREGPDWGDISSRMIASE